MGKIVITGASGRYGRMATDGLIARGRAADLILMTRDPAKLADRIAAGCMVRYGDFDRPETLGPVMAGAERLFASLRAVPGAGRALCVTPASPGGVAVALAPTAASYNILCNGYARAGRADDAAALLPEMRLAG